MLKLNVYLLLLLCLALPAQAQGQGIASTWSFPVMARLTDSLVHGRAVANPAASVFVPGPDPGVAQLLAHAMAGRPEDEAPMLEEIAALRKVYDDAQIKEGRPYNVASALTYFLACNLAVYNDDEPSGEAQRRLYQQLESAIAATPEIASLSDADKQRMHDWLVGAGGLSLTIYVGANLSKDETAQQSARALAGLAMQTVMGVEPQGLILDEKGLTVDPGL